MHTRTKFYKPVFVETIPEKLKSGHIYISLEYNVAVHLCACGCGRTVITPLGTHGWTISFARNKLTLSPSIGNFNYPCSSHYFIIKNNVVWCDERDHGRKLKKRNRSLKSLFKKIF